MLRSTPIAALCVAALTIGSAPASGADLPFGPDLETAGWQHREFSDIKPAAFALLPDGALNVSSESGASILCLDVSEMEGAAAVMSWEWRVETAVPATDVTKTKGADRNLAVHIWFPPESDGGMFSALAGSFMSALGIPQVGHTLTYIWGGVQPKGARFVNPHYKPRGRMIVLQSSDAPTGQWLMEKVDIARDFEIAFGHPPKRRPKYIAVSTDSDDTGTQSKAQIRGLRFDPAS